MEICTRALSFWTYQTSQEAKYQEMTQKNLEDKLSSIEKQHQRMTREMNTELTGMPRIPDYYYYFLDFKIRVIERTLTIRSFHPWLLGIGFRETVGCERLLCI